MRSLRALWLAAALVTCVFHLASACDEDQKQAGQHTSGQGPTAQTVVLSCSNDKIRFVRDARVLSGPATFQQAALKLVNRKKYKGKAIDPSGTGPAGHSSQQLMLAVTFLA